MEQQAQGKNYRKMLVLPLSVFFMIFFALVIPHMVYRKQLEALERRLYQSEKDTKKQKCASRALERRLYEKDAKKQKCTSRSFFLMIHSGNAERRQVCRETWLSSLDKWKNTHKLDSIDYRFVVGDSKDNIEEVG